MATINKPLLITDSTTGGNVPNSKMLLEVRGTSGGMMMPKLTTAEKTALAAGISEQGMVVYDTDNSSAEVFNGTVWGAVGAGSDPNLNATAPIVPNYDFSNFTLQGLQQYISGNTGYSNETVVAYTHGATAVNQAYAGGVYSPNQNRIYFMPSGQADETNWHYVDCSDGSVVAYAHGATVVNDGYFGGVYSPTQDRIYFVPLFQSNQTNWHYIDCSDGSVVAYAHGATVVIQGYNGGVYSPTQNRIYLIPAGQVTETNWHYIDCSDGSVVAYAHGATAISGAYSGGGVYSPTQNRIYFVPSAQATETNWHYIDCSNGSVVAYVHGATVAGAGYNGGTYSPTQNRIYFVPSIASIGDATWYYIDCSDGSVVGYTHGIGITPDFFGTYFFRAVYSPTQNRIYFVPARDLPNWYYIDCSDGSVVAYPSVAIATGNTYIGGTYSPTENRIYFVPNGQSDEPNWHYISDIDEESIPPVSKTLMAGALFNKL